MKKPALLATGLVALFLASADSAVALQWRGDLARLTMAPGALLPVLAPLCAGDLEILEPDQAELEDCLDYVADWIATASIEEIDATLEANGANDGSLDVTGAELKEMSREDLGDFANAQSSEALSALVAECKKGKVVPCKTASVSGWCKSGVRCTSATCTEEDGSTKNCVTKILKQQNPLWIGCPGFTWTSYSCPTPCPVPAWTWLLGALGSSAWFFLRRRLHPIV